MFSGVVPLYNEEEIIPELARRLAEAAALWGDHEIIFVNDGSLDRTEELLKSVVAQTPGWRLITFSRNFGHQAAVSAAGGESSDVSRVCASQHFSLSGKKLGRVERLIEAALIAAYRFQRQANQLGQILVKSVLFRFAEAARLHHYGGVMIESKTTGVFDDLTEIALGPKAAVIPGCRR